VQNRGAMEHYTIGLLNGIGRWISSNFHIDSLEVSGDLARSPAEKRLR
jgi:hypothetical protein